MTSCMRFKDRRNVDLPHPDGPMSAVTCLGSTVMVTSARAWKVPNQALRPSTSTCLAMWIPRSDKPVAAGEDAGDDRQQKHDDDEGEGPGPGPVHRHGEGGAGLREHEQRQRRLRPAERVRPYGIEPERREQDRKSTRLNSSHAN